MPNHVHGIIVLSNGGPRIPHGADHIHSPIAAHDIIVLSNGGPRIPHGADHIHSPIAAHDIIVRADPRVRPIPNDGHRPIPNDGHRPIPNDVADERGGHTGPPLRRRGATDRVVVPTGRGAVRYRDSTDRVAVGTVVQWFKTMSTNEYIRGVKTLGWPSFDGRVWQRDYWERIVRNADELVRIRRYIANNPRAWWKDRNNPGGYRVAPFAGQRIVKD